KLTLLIDALDAEQFAGIAAQLRAEREAMERQARTLRERLGNQNSVMPDLTTDTLAALPKTAIKDALSKSIAFIAVGKMGTGVIVLTRWGSYIVGSFRKGDPTKGECKASTFIDSSTVDAL